MVGRRIPAAQEPGADPVASDPAARM